MTANLPAAQSEHVAAFASVLPLGPYRPTAHGVPEHGFAPELECVPDAQLPSWNTTSNPVCCKELSDVKRKSKLAPLELTAAGSEFPSYLASCGAELEAPSYKYRKSYPDSVSKREKRMCTCRPLGAVISHSQSALAAYGSVDTEPSVND